MTKTATSQQWICLKFDVPGWINQGAGSKIQRCFLNQHVFVYGTENSPKVQYSFTPPELKFQVALYFRISYEMYCTLVFLGSWGDLVDINASNTRKVKKGHHDPHNLPWEATLSDMLLKQTIEEAVPHWGRLQEISAQNATWGLWKDIGFVFPTEKMG